MADDERLSSVRERGRANLFWRYLGIDVEAAGEGWVRLRVPMRDELRNAPGAPVHGGVLATLVDAAVGGALGTYGSAATGVTTTIKAYPKVSQFWTYDEKWFLAQPVYSRDYPPLKS